MNSLSDEQSRMNSLSDEQSLGILFLDDNTSLVKPSLYWVFLNALGDSHSPLAAAIGYTAQAPPGIGGCKELWPQMKASERHGTKYELRLGLCAWRNSGLWFHVFEILVPILQ